jgi:MYXO-CTERM domain-containing protein
MLISFVMGEVVGMTRFHTAALSAAAAALLFSHGASAQWSGLTDESTALMTDSFPFFGSHPEAGGNENYYDGDIGDFDGDGLPDRLLGARYGLLLNTGGGLMVPIRRNVGLLLRGDPGASGWGEDAMALIDVDGDGDLDALSGGNGEPLSLQINGAWRFSVAFSMSGHSALNIVPTDLEGDGDADLFVAHSFCVSASCGGPVDFGVLRNDGSGGFTEVTGPSGLALSSGEFVVGVVSGDVDGDGDFDAVIQRGTSSSTAIVVAINDGSGTFTENVISMPTGCSGFGQNSALGDIDDDGDLDLMMGRCPGSGTYTGGHPVSLHVLALNDGSGVFTDESATMFDTTAYAGTDPLGGNNTMIIDIDYDGDLDFIAVRKANGSLGLATHHLQLFLNDGTGTMVYSDTYSASFTGRTSGLGADVDVGDLDGDGDYDLWLGFGSDIVHIFMNDYTDPSGLPADQPRSLRVVSETASGVTIGWQAPPFASNARSYRVYRSLAPGMHDRDRVHVATVGQSAHLDYDFYGTIDSHTTTADLGDPDVTIDGSTGEIQWTDTTAQPGVRYWYTVAHVGPEHEESAHAPEVAAMTPAPGGADATGPELEIVSPTQQDWQRSPRIVVTYGDGGSGVDPSTLSVSFDEAFGPIAADANLVSSAYRHDGRAFIAWFEPPNELPDDTLVTMTASVEDMAGNVTTETLQFFVSISPAILSSPMLPSAAFTPSATSGTAPITIDFDASASGDPDGHLLRYEWYWGDASTGLGRQTSHTFDFAGTYDVTLLVRDNEGGVATTSQTITLGGSPPPPDGGVADGGADGAVDAAPDGTMCTPDCTGRSCGDDGCGGTCGACGADEVCASAMCMCAGATVPCGSACVDTRNDTDHCGACDSPCAAGETCSAGTCGTGPCMPDCTGRTCGDDGCGGSCGDCMTAGQVCASGGQCLCGDGSTGCGSDCVDLRSNSLHCGACDNVCGDEEACVAGVCTAGTTPPDDDGGCGCTTVGSGSSSLAWLALLPIAGLFLRRRRKG